VLVMPELGDGTAPQRADRGRLRASHADREQAIEVLKDAFVQERLARDEFDERAGRAFAARTYASQLPPGPGHGGKPSKRAACLNLS
jgi:hypothetical protein